MEHSQLSSLECYLQGNLKGESVVAAILPSRMKVSYCTSGFFSKLSPPSMRELPFPRGHKSRMHNDYCAVNNDNVRAISEGTITHLHT